MMACTDVWHRAYIQLLYVSVVMELVWSEQNSSVSGWSCIKRLTGHVTTEDKSHDCSYQCYIVFMLMMWRNPLTRIVLEHSSKIFHTAVVTGHTCFCLLEPTHPPTHTQKNWRQWHASHCLGDWSEVYLKHDKKQLCDVQCTNFNRVHV